MLPPPGTIEILLLVLATLLVGFTLGSLIEQRLARRISPTAEHAAAALRAAEDKYRAIFENAIEGIFQTTPDGGYIAANPKLAAIYGYPSVPELTESLRNIERQLYVDPCRRYEFVRLMEEHDEIVDFESQVYRRDGSVIWISENARAIRNAAGEILYYEGTVEDITQRKQSAALQAEKEAAVAASQAKSAFLAHMSHEIRTPLNGVIGMLQLVAGTRLDQRQVRYIKIAQDSADNLLALLNDVLDFSKIEAGKLELETIPFNLHELLEDVTEQFSHRAAAKSLELSCRVGLDVPDAVRGDSKRLRQVLTNLLGNAIKFTERGEVALAAELVECGGGLATIRLEVRDTGIGIPADRQHRLFAPFSQVDGSTTRKYGGSGLGLAICRQIVDLMGGQIGAESQPGQGSTFWCELPLELAAAIAGQSCGPHELRGLKVLLIDDQPASVRVLRELLAGWGISLQSSSRIDEALVRLRQAADSSQPFALAILAHQPPRTDSLVLARQIKADPRLANLPLLAVSSIDATLDPGSLAAAGLAAAIAKPIRQSRLLDAIVSALHEGDTLATGRDVSLVQDNTPLVVQPPAVSGRILVAEDNEINQLVTCEILRTAGYACEVVASGSEAVKAVRRSSYALVLMDCQMPELDGFEATEWIRKLEARGELKHATGGPIPIIALTANAVQGDRERCLAAGMNDYATKPVDRLRLLEMVAKYVQGETPAQAAPPSIAETTSTSSIVAGDLLARCSGDATLAARLLVKFRDRLPDQGRQIAAAIATDRKQARQLAHALKGTAANMAAGSLSSAAARLEQTLADTAADPVPSLRALDEQITRCLDDLSALLAEQSAAATPPPADTEHACAS